MPFLRMRIRHGWLSDVCYDNKVGPLTDFDDYKFSLTLILDECTSELPRDAFHANWNYAEAFARTRRQQSGTFNRLCSYKCSLALDFDECTSELPRDAFLASRREEGMQVECNWNYAEALARTRRQQSGTFNRLCSYKCSLALDFDECTSELLRDAFLASRREEGMQVECNWNYAEALARTRRQQSGTFNRLCSYKCSLALDFDECTSELPRDAILASRREEGMQVECNWNYAEALARTRRQQSGTFNRLCSYKCSLALDFDECTSELPRDAILASRREEGMQVECNWNYAEALARTRRQQSGTFNRLCSYKCSLALDFDECTSELPRDAFLASRREEGMQVECNIEELIGLQHDRSCLEMSEADGVDGGAFRKRGLTHLQWAEKPEAPEAERHLGTRISRVSVSPWVSECSNLLAVGPGSEILPLHENLMGRKHDRSCLEMSEADGVDGGAFRKRGLTHLQWAEKPEAPEAERHLGTRIQNYNFFIALIYSYLFSFIIFYSHLLYLNESPLIRWFPHAATFM
ncbi:LOW QUALITY PROTEIN: hypothetical protein V1478_005242 [Vespula squamosa]|uniref:Uncharacterized protein n=1 Tax=Vespula squamosa TaxID=30214 RepID=A0ABD2BDR4_VESSQ